MQNRRYITQEQIAAMGKQTERQEFAGATRGSTSSALDGLFTGYSVKHTLRADDWGRTQVAVSRSGGQRVIIKSCFTKRFRAAYLMRMRYEASVLSKLKSESYNSPLEIITDRDAIHIVYPYRRGTFLEKRLRIGPFDVHDVIRLARDLLSGLKDLHEKRIFHRGVRPSNILVNSGQRIRKAVLIDLGGVNPAVATTQDGKRFEIDARYYSPELAGLIDHDITAAADLYSLGVVLFECLTGYAPFQGTDLNSVLFSHMTENAPELRTLGVPVPRVLDEVIQRLLRKDPRDRYQSADATLKDVIAIQESLEGGQDEPSIVIGSGDSRRTLVEPAFVSRASELNVFTEQMEAAASGAPTLILLEGESGCGKTRLLTEVSRRAARKGLRVLRGIASSDVAQRPFHILDGVVEKFLSDSQTSPRYVRHVKDRLGQEAEVVSAAIPDLRNLLGSPVDVATGPELMGEIRTIRALATFLSALGTEDAPAMIFLDDCQWADELTFKLIRFWHSQSIPEHEAQHVILVAAFRSEEVAAEHVLRQLESAKHLTLSLFVPEEIRQLAESMAGQLPEAALEIVVQLGGGSPFVSAAVLHGLVESGALFHEDGEWRLDSLAIGEIHSSDREAGFLTKRLDLLSPEVVNFLTAGAVIGKQFDIEMVSDLAEQEPGIAISAMDVARQRQLIWCRPDGVTCVFMHDKIRRALLDRLSSEQLQAFHFRAAQYYKRVDPDRISELAYHFDAAGASRQAFFYALDAAEESRARYALETAQQQYEIARKGASSRHLKVQYRVAEGLGDVLMLRGNYDGAGELFEEAERIASSNGSNGTQAQIRGKLAELSFKRGEMERALGAYEDALRSLNRWIPKNRITLLLWMIWEVVIQVLHTLFPSVFVHRRRREPTESERLAIRLFSGLAHCCWYSRGCVSTLWAHLRGLNLAESFPPTHELGNAYSEHAPVMSLLRLFGRGVRYAEKSLAIRRELGDLWGQGQSLHYYGVVLYAASRYSECINRCRESVRLLERMGDYWQVHVARYQIAASYYRMGQHSLAIEESQKNHQSGIYLGDEQASGIIFDVWARAAHGDCPQDMLEKELHRERFDPQGQAQVLFASGICLIYQDRFQQACERLDEAIRVIMESGVCNSYTLPVRVWAVTAYRRLAESLPDYTPKRRRQFLRKAWTTARVARLATWRCQNDRPHLHRELALLHSLAGQMRPARRHFQKSLEWAKRHECRYEFAQTLSAMAKVGAEFGWAIDETELAEAEAILAELEAPDQLNVATQSAETAVPSLSLADRFETVLQSGRKIATGLSESAIFQETFAAACRLLRVHHGVIIQVDREQPISAWKALAGNLGWEIDTALVEQALNFSRAVANSHGRTYQNRQLDRVDAPSELCVPISRRGKPVACLSVMHSEIRDLFAGDEERLADFLATIAGAALENAEGFAELQDLNATLERRVAERTKVLESRSRELATSNHELERTAQELRQAQVQLSASKQAAEAASDAKSRFLATMSHEIRTPMNGILGMADLVLGSALNDRQRGYLETLKHSANALLRLLNDLLDFSKIEAGKMDLEAIPFSLRDVVSDSARLLAIPAGRKGLEFITRIEPDVPSSVIGDPNRLRQIIVNLIGNAIKFTPEGELTVHVAVQNRSPEEPLLRITIRDTGIGIPAEKQKSIFEAFHQTDSSVTRRFGGTGLGLAITAQLVGLMDGTIHVESDEGRGTAFHLDIPFHVANQVGTKEPPPLEIGREIVLLSDHNLSRTATEELIEFLGLPVILEETLSERPAPASHPIVIVDFSQHSEGLLETMIQRMADGENQPGDFICVLPAGKNELTEKCEALEIPHVITKPVKPQELSKAIQSVAGCTLEQEAVDRPPRSCKGDSLDILVADDSPVNREVAAGLIEMCGHRVRSVENGRDAVDLLNEEDFDLVFMDVEMPVMDGFAATEAIRRLPNAKSQILVYAMTAHALAETEEKCLEAGMDGVITKPIVPETLMELLEQAATPT